MRYLLLMFFKYYRGSRETKHIAYFSALSAVILYGCIIFFGITSLLKIDFEIMGMSKNKIQNYFVFGLILFPIYFVVYCIYPPKLIVKEYSKFENSIIKNVLIIIVLIIMFSMIFFKFSDR